MDRGAWWATVHGVAKSWTGLSDKHKITAAMKLKDTCSMGKKAMTNLDSLLKADITLPTKVHLVKPMVFQ